jgi:hypothetical protein
MYCNIRGPEGTRTIVNLEEINNMRRQSILLLQKPNPNKPSSTGPSLAL